MSIGWPQIIVIALWCIGLGMHAAKHGERIEFNGKPNEYNVWHRMFGIAVWACLLWWGGFWQ